MLSRKIINNFTSVKLCVSIYLQLLNLNHICEIFFLISSRNLTKNYLHRTIKTCSPFLYFWNTRQYNFQKWFKLRQIIPYSFYPKLYYLPLNSSKNASLYCKGKLAFKEFSPSKGYKKILHSETFHAVTGKNTIDAKFLSDFFRNFIPREICNNYIP